MFSLAQEILFDRYKNPQYAGELEIYDLKVEGANSICGDELIIFATRDIDGKFLTIKHRSRACAVCAASTELLIDYLLGKNLEEAREISTEKIQTMLDIPLSPLRLKCALLPLETLKQAEI